MDDLKLYIEKIGGVSEFAKRMDCSESLVRHVLSGRRGISKSFAKKAEDISGGFIKKERLLWSSAA